MAEVLRVSRSGFYAWLHRPPSARAERDAEITEAVRVSHAESDGSYGALQVHADLRESGFRVGKNRVARLMRQHGIIGVTCRRGPATTARAPW
jgi:putative transposase